MTPEEFILLPRPRKLIRRCETSARPDADTTVRLDPGAVPQPEGYRLVVDEAGRAGDGETNEGEGGEEQNETTGRQAGRPGGGLETRHPFTCATSAPPRRCS